MTAKTVETVLTEAGITKTTTALTAIYTAMQLGTSGTQTDIMEAAGTKDTATRLALAELVSSGLVVRTEGSGNGKNRTPNTYTLPVAKKAAKKTSAKKSEPKADAETSAKTDDGRYGKAMTQILDHLMKNPGVPFTVKRLMDELERPWYNATNTACKALAARETGVTEVTDAKVREYVYNG